MIYIFVILVLVLIYLFIKYYFMRSNVRILTSELKELNRNISETNSKMYIGAPDGSTENLAAEINKFVDVYKELQKEVLGERRENKRMMADFSHDLRTPLTSVIGYIDVILNFSISEKDKEQYMKTVKCKLEALNNMIDLLYDFSLIDSGEYPVEFASCSIYQILCDSILMFHKDFERKHIDLKLDIDENTPLIMIDEKITTRIFMNLLKNVLRYGDTYCKIEMKTEDEYVYVGILNDCEYMNEEDVQKLFERMYKKDATRSMNSSGLGLSIVREFMKLQMGKIEASYKYGVLKLQLYFKR